MKLFPLGISTSSETEQLFVPILEIYNSESRACLNRLQMLIIYHTISLMDSNVATK